MCISLTGPFILEGRQRPINKPTKRKCTKLFKQIVEFRLYALKKELRELTKSYIRVVVKLKSENCPIRTRMKPGKSVFNCTKNGSALSVLTKKGLLITAKPC